MRRDIDPIKIIKILPLSGRQDKRPDNRRSWFDRLKNAVRSSTQRAKSWLRRIGDRLVYTTQTVRPSQNFLKHFRAQHEIGLNQGSDDASIRANIRVPSRSADVRMTTYVARVSRGASSGMKSIRRKIVASWIASKAYLESMKSTCTMHMSGWRENIPPISHAGIDFGAQRRRLGRRVSSVFIAIRAMGRRHNSLRVELDAVRALAEQRHADLLDQTARLSSMQSDLATQRKVLDELTSQMKSLQAKMAQPLPITHGTTGQSGPVVPGKRGTTGKRNDPRETRPQPRADH